MASSRSWLLRILCPLLLLATPVAAQYRIEKTDPGAPPLAQRFTPEQLSLLEKINRVDIAHMPRLKELVIPSTWGEELAFSPFPPSFPAAAAIPKVIVVDQPAQAFAAYESGTLVYWGPTSSGRQAKPTPSGVYHLNWKTRSRASTLSGEWILKWYFNFHNTRGLAFHEFELPGLPMSHACVRLLARDAMWIYQWGQGWTVDAKGQLLQAGTPVVIQGDYNFKALPPWLSLEVLRKPIALPQAFPN